jgi:glyoxylase-like metal-dependent hydrolase (beta-lactamase superfamily II)
MRRWLSTPGHRSRKRTDVRTIVLTHLHWDHAANTAKFPNAVFLAQRREIEFFKSHAREHPSMNRFFSHQADLRQLIDEGRIKPVDGDSAIAPGIRAMHVGGHTPGSQMLMVETAEGPAVITGDAVPLHRNYVDNIPSGIVVNAVEAIAALERVRTLRPVAIYTGHDLEPVLRPK